MVRGAGTHGTCLAALCALGLCLSILALSAHPAGLWQPIAIRGHTQLLRLYGSSEGQPVIVSSGDGGWIHLAPHVAAVLAARGFFVAGFDTRSYLWSFTTAAGTLRPNDEPGDYLELARFLSRTSGRKPVLVGVSEGAGLSVLAATDPRTRAAIAGVVGLGLPDVNELGWRLRDASIYLTHGIPSEPTFSATAIVDRVSPAPLALIYSTRDEFVPIDQVRHIFDAAAAPKQLWLIDASSHRFDGRTAELDARLVEAVDWILRSAGVPEERVPRADTRTRSSAPLLD